MSRRVILLGSLVAGGAVAYFAGGLLARSFRSSDPVQQTSNSVLLVEGVDTESVLRETEKFTRELRLTNKAAEPVRLTGFENSCSCLSVEPSGAATFAPGETKTYTVVLSGLIPDRETVAADGVFRQSVMLTPVFAVGESATLQRFTFPIRYSIRAGVRLSPAAVQLGILSDRAKAEPRTVTCQLMDGVANVAVEPHAEWSASVEPNGPQSRILKLHPKNPKLIRDIDDTLRVVPLDDTGTKFPAKSLRLVGEVKTDIQAEPASVPFGRMTVGATAEDVFRLVSLTRRPFAVTSVTSASGDVTARFDPADPKSCHVRLTATQLGEQEIALSVRVKQDDDSEVTVTVPVRYRGEPRTEGGQ